MSVSFAQMVRAASPQLTGEPTAIFGYIQFLLAIAGVLFALGLLLLILASGIDARASEAAVKKARRALRARLGA